MTTPAEEIRTAADTLRKLATDATPGPWTWQRWHSDTCPADCDDPTCFLLIVGSPHGPVGDADVDRDVFAVERSVQERGEGDAAYIAAMGPNVGALLADWLEFHAAMDERLLALVDGAPGMDEATWGGNPHPALALARAVNAAARTTSEARR